MKLKTKELEEIFERYPIYSQKGLGGKAKVIAKFFNPIGPGTWLITEADKQENGDYEMFGYCHLGDDTLAELGYIFLSQLEEISFPLGMTIERDLYYSKDIQLVDAIKQEGFKIPRFMLENLDDESV
jgi:Protein of unknown function (DUF2958).